jgi:hypothetical protein
MVSRPDNGAAPLAAMASVKRWRLPVLPITTQTTESIMTGANITLYDDDGMIVMNIWCKGRESEGFYAQLTPNEARALSRNLLSLACGREDFNKLETLHHAESHM